MAPLFKQVQLYVSLMILSLYHYFVLFLSFDMHIKHSLIKKNKKDSQNQRLSESLLIFNFSLEYLQTAFKFNLEPFKNPLLFDMKFLMY